MGDKVYSSETAGYLLLPSLITGKYPLIIGFPGEQKTENRFEVSVNGEDKGFTIAEESGLIYLNDLHSNKKIKPLDEPGLAGVRYEIRTDSFSILLSRASNDPSLGRVPIFPKEDLAKETATPKLSETETVKDDVVEAENTEVVVAEVIPPVVEVVYADSSIAHSETKPGIENKEDSVDSGPVSEPFQDTIAVLSEIPGNRTDTVNNIVGSGVLRYAESSTGEGFLLSFIDLSSNDTIRLVIPNPRFKLVEDALPKEEESLFLEIERKDLVKDSVENAGRINSSGEVEVRVTEKNDIENKEINKGNHCRRVAGEKDFLKLRKNMAGQNSDEAMVDEARKVFKSRCFTTEQVKHLSGLFLTSAGKYLFFDAAYLHVTDRDAFPQLETEIRDDYYLRRFKALIGVR